MAHAPAVHANVPQLVLLVVHDPAPLQTLVLSVVELEQLDAPHSPRPRRPLATRVHVPLLPATPVSAAEHALQLPVHAVLQQNPSTQSPLLHSRAPVLHVAPEDFLATHAPPLQNAVLAQPLSSTQVVGQAAPVWHA